MMHSIKSRKQRVFLLKVDLSKIYDYIDWEFLFLVLLKSGMSLFNIKRILACCKTTNFVVNINGFPSQIFNAYRGIR